MTTTTQPVAGLTPNELAKLLRVSSTKIYTWIDSGELRAVNTASVTCGRPKWVILPEALAEFERRRQGGPPVNPAPRRRRAKEEIDYYPD